MMCTYGLHVFPCFTSSCIPLYRFFFGEGSQNSAPGPRESNEGSSESPWRWAVRDFSVSSHTSAELSGETI